MHSGERRTIPALANAREAVTADRADDVQTMSGGG